MENSSILSNRQSGIPRGPPKSRTPKLLSPAEEASTQKGPAKSLFEASGAGLSLCAPKVPASFVISSVAQRKLKASDLKAAIKGSVTLKPDIRERKDDALEVTYTAPMSGEYRITLSLGAIPVGGSPFRMSCQQPRPCESTSVLDLGEASAFAGEVFRAQLQVRDQFGDAFCGRVDLAADVMDGSTKLFAASCADLGNGIHEVYFQPEIAGAYGLAIALEGRQLSGSPYQIRIRNDETVAANCKLYGGGLTHGEAGARNAFFIQAVDGKQNARLVGGDKFAVDISGPMHPAAFMKDAMNGTYKVSWASETAGIYLINVTLDGCLVGGCPASCIVHPGQLDPAHCSSSGPGLSHAQAGTPAVFTIATADRYGNPLIAGCSGDLAVQLVRADVEGGAPSAVEGCVTDSEQGRFLGQFTVNTAGVYHVTVTAAGQPLSGSPWACHVAAADVHPASCRLYGPGLTSIQLGCDSLIFVELADRFGNPVSATDVHPLGVKISVGGANSLPARHISAEGGTHTFCYRADSAGTFVISATLHGEHFTNSPATVIASIAEADAQLCEVMGASLQLTATAGDVAEFTIAAKDAAGVKKSLGGDIFTAEWRLANGEGSITVGKVEDLGTGEYRCCFSAPIAGSYNVFVKHRGGNIAGSPFLAIVFPAEIDAACCQVVGEGIALARSGHKVSFMLHPRDRFGNPVAVTAFVAKGFQATIRCQAGDLAPEWAPFDAEASTALTCSYMPSSTASLEVQLAYKGASLQHSPWQVPVLPGAAAADASALEGLPPTLVAGQPARLCLYARDAQGNTTAGGDDVAIFVESVAQGRQSLLVTDNKNGTYTAELSPHAGLTLLSATVNSQLLGQHVSLAVVPGPLHCLTLQSPLPLGAVAGEPMSVFVGGEDAFGNAVLHGGAHLEACIGQPGAADTPGNVRDLGQGLYEVSCSMTTAGPFQLDIWTRDLASTKLSWTGECQPAETSPEHCVVDRLPLEVNAGEEGSLSLWRRDRFGNVAHSGIGMLAYVAQGSGPGCMTTAMMESAGSQVVVRYSATKSGSYSLAVAGAVGGRQVPGSPFAVAVEPAAPAAAFCRATSSVTGSEAAVIVECCDRYGNSVKELPASDIQVHAVGPREAVLLSDGSRTFRKSLTVAGAYLVHATLGGDPLPGCPHAITISPGKPCAIRCELSGEALHGLVIGELAELLLATFDSNGNALTTGGHEVTCSLACKGSDSSQALVIDRGNGCYSLSFTPSALGVWNLHPRINGQPLREAGLEVLAVHGMLTALDCTVTADFTYERGTVCGQTSCINVSPVAADRQFSGDEVVSAVLTGASGLQMVLLGCLEGGGRKWMLKHQWIRAGKYQVEILLNGACIPGGRFDLQVTPGTPVLGHCETLDTGAANCIAGEPFQFRFRANDKFGNAVPAVTSAFSISATTGDEEMQGELISEGEGVYASNFVINRSGEYSVNLVLGGDTRSFRGVCYAGALDLEKSDHFCWDDLLKAGQTGWLTYQPRDRYGNAIVEPMQHLTSVLASSTSQLSVSQPLCLKDGRMAITYTTREAGSYEISLTGSHAGDGLEFAVEVAPLTAAPSHTTARLCNSSTPELSVVAGDEVVIDVDLRDEYGNVTADLGAQDLSVTSRGPATAVFIREDRDGTSVFTAKCTTAGSCLLVPMLGCTILPSWPRTLIVRPAGAVSGYLSGAALKGVTCASPGVATLHLLDDFGNHVIGDQAAIVTGSLQHDESHSQVEAEVRGAPDGTCALIFTLPIPGTWSLSVTINGNLIPYHSNERSITTITATWGALRVADFELAPRLQALVCGSAYTFNLTAQGREASAVGRVTAIMSTPSKERVHVPVELAEGGKSLLGSVTCLTAGQHQVDILFDGEHIPGSPVTFEAHAADLHAPSCIIEGLSPVSCGHASFKVHGRDAFGNTCSLSVEDVTIHIEPEAALPRIELQQGEHCIAVALSDLSQGTLFVRVRGEAVSSSGWQLVAAPGVAHCLKFITTALSTTAGSPVIALVEALDRQGSRLHQRCPGLTARLLSDTDGADVGAVEVLNARDNGTAEVSVSVCQAGVYHLEVALSGGSGTAITCPVSCEPGPVFASHATVDQTAFQHWQAGTPATLVITHADRFGNRISTAVPPLTAVLSGPGSASASVQSCAEGVSEVTCSAHLSGSYSLTVTDAASLKPIKGSPFQLCLRPGPLSEAHSLFRIEGAEAVGTAGVCVEAGRQLVVLADLQDKCGNAVGVDAACINMRGMGVNGAFHLEPLQGSCFQARPTAAGMHTLSATAALPSGIINIPPARGSASVNIVPGPVSCRRSFLRDLPQSLMAGTPVEVEVVPVDEFGNVGAFGGSFSAALLPSNGASSVKCDVRESTAGTRVVVVTLLAQRVGEYTLRISYMRHASDEQETVAESAVHVEEACACASTSTVTGFWPNQGALAGIPAGFIVQACDEFGNRRRAGGDTFAVEVQGQEAVPLHDRGDGTYAGALALPAEGSYMLRVTLQGRNLQGSPASFQVFRNVGALAEQEMQRRLSSTVAGLRRGISAARGLHSSLRAEAVSLQDFIPVLLENTRSGISQVLRQQEALAEETRLAFVRESAERRRLHNLVQELRGNIRVYVRVKPLTQHERQAGDTSVLRCEGGHRVQCSAGSSLKAFDFDRAFGGEATQAEVFNEVSQLVTSALDGYNVCIFAYGQTGAGKTYTMEGTAQDPGINYRTMQELFRCIHEERPEHSYTIAASLVQIYNEEVQDLLAPGGKKTVDLQRSTTGFSIPSLTHCVVTSAEQIQHIVSKGYEQRTVGCHDINAHSSRSHCLLIIQVTATDASTGIRTIGKLTLCDLAGSERIQKTHATGLTLAEAQNINRSLLELGNVVSALMQQSNHVPYRNSKLTMLLQDSLGGDAKALMIANLAPSAAHAVETLSSLNFAAKVANVVLKTPQRNFEEGDGSGKADRKVAAAVSRRPRV